jgi:transcriptional regulator with XRE-family HTH domain
VGQVKNQKLMEQIARKIKSLRGKSGLSQEAVYHDTGIHIGRIEAGQSNITVSTLDAICTYFDTDLETFFVEIKK